MTHCAARCECHYLYMTQLFNSQLCPKAYKYKTMWNIIMVVGAAVVLCWECRVCRLSLASSLFIFKVNARWNVQITPERQICKSNIRPIALVVLFSWILFSLLCLFHVILLGFVSACGETLSIDNDFLVLFLFVVNLLMFIRSFKEIHTEQRLKFDVFLAV